MKRLKVVGLNFDHMHMGDLLRKCREHPGVEIAGICDDDPARMQAAMADLQIPSARVFTDPHRCLEATEPDFVILCPATARHADYVELVAPYRVHMLVEKPFAATLRDADRMIAAAKRATRLLAINWPLRWYPSHVTAHRLLREGVSADLAFARTMGSLGRTCHRLAVFRVRREEPCTQDQPPAPGIGS